MICVLIWLQILQGTAPNILLCLTPDDFIYQCEKSRWESVKWNSPFQIVSPALFQHAPQPISDNALISRTTNKNVFATDLNSAHGVKTKPIKAAKPWMLGINVVSLQNVNVILMANVPRWLKLLINGRCSVAYLAIITVPLVLIPIFEATSKRSCLSCGSSFNATLLTESRSILVALK